MDQGYCMHIQYWAYCITAAVFSPTADSTFLSAQLVSCNGAAVIRHVKTPVAVARGQQKNSPNSPICQGGDSVTGDKQMCIGVKTVSQIMCRGVVLHG